VHVLYSTCCNIKSYGRHELGNKYNLFFAVISMILLSANALAVSVDNNENEIIATNVQGKCAMNINSLVADFDITASFSTEPPTINFRDKSTGSPIFWSWNFGDNNTSIARNPTHKYSVPGKYTVTLTVTKLMHTSTVTKIIIFTGYEKDESHFQKPIKNTFLIGLSS
jgi:PKD repeat protein